MNIANDFFFLKKLIRARADSGGKYAHKEYRTCESLQSPNANFAFQDAN